MWMTKWHGTFLPGGLFCVLRVEVVIPAYTLLIYIEVYLQEGNCTVFSN